MAGTGTTTPKEGNIHSHITYPQNQLVSIKLDENNFLIWRQQVLAAIRGYGLEGFITGTSEIPPEFISEQGKEKDTIVKVPNPEYTIWLRQDSILSSWILSSLTENILTLMVGLETSSEIWHTLDKNFTSHSEARKMQYKLQLQTLKKDKLSMREYLSKMKGCCDVLASVGYKLSSEDKILHILAGLGPEYDSVMVTFTSKPGA